MTQASTPGGWYPVPNDPNTERYWNGNEWTEHHRPRQQAPVPPAPSSGGGSSAGKIILGIVIGILVLMGGCVAYVVILVDSTVDTFETLTATTLKDDGGPGSITNPLVFGTPHTRAPGISGSGWDVSVDEVRDLGAGCLAVFGTATLIVLEGERTFSSPRSFPEIELVSANEEVTRPNNCNRTDVAGDGRLWAQNLELLEGTTFTWFETFEAAPDSFRYVSVSGTLYWS